VPLKGALGYCLTAEPPQADFKLRITLPHEATPRTRVVVLTPAPLLIRGYPTVQIWTDKPVDLCICCPADHSGGANWEESMRNMTCSKSCLKVPFGLAVETISNN
jgi:hypothetical protein